MWPEQRGIHAFWLWDTRLADALEPWDTHVRHGNQEKRNAILATPRGMRVWGRAARKRGTWARDT